MVQHHHQHNQAKQFAQRLVDVHGYLQDDDYPKSFVRLVDDDNALRVSVDSNNLTAEGDERGNLSVRFGLARRDINEHEASWLPASLEFSHWWSPTVSETNRFLFFGERPMAWGQTVPFSDYEGELDLALAELERCGTLDCIEMLLFREDSGIRYAWRRVITDVLSGRSDRSLADYEHLREESGAKPEGDSFRQRFERFDASVQEFRREHPAGIR